jgi:Ca2+:H+ antiporter
LFSLWINILLLTVPVGFVVNYFYINGIVIFIVNFITIIPLAVILNYTTKEIVLRANNTLGGLLNATFRYISPLLICPNII